MSLQKSVIIFELQEQLEQMILARDTLFEELHFVADQQDYSAMETADLAEVMKQPKLVPKENVYERFWQNFTDQLRALVRRPAVSFALGAMAMVLVTNITGTETQDSPASSPAPTIASHDTSEELLRSPEGEDSFDKVEASLVVETISSRQGRVEVRSRPDDPDAPTVIWYSSESRTGRVPDRPERLDETDEDDITPNEGNPL